MVHSFLLKQQSRHHRTWTCLSNFRNPKCLLTTFLIWWCFNRMEPHRILRNYLNDTFPGRWIGQGSPVFWAAGSSDLTPLAIFTWVTSRLRCTRWRLGNCSTCMNAFQQQCIQLPQQCCSVCSGAPRKDGNSAWIWRTIMSNSSDFIECLHPYYKNFIWN